MGYVLSVELTFETEDEALRSKLSGELLDHLLEAEPGLSIRRVSDKEKSQDLGALLELALNGSVPTALVTGIGTFLAARRRAVLKLRRKRIDGTVAEITAEGRLGRKKMKLIRDFLDGA